MVAGRLLLRKFLGDVLRPTSLLLLVVGDDGASVAGLTPSFFEGTLIQIWLSVFEVGVIRDQLLCERVACLLRRASVCLRRH